MRERRQCFLKWFCSRQSWPCLDLSDLWYFEPEPWCLAFGVCWRIIFDVVFAETCTKLMVTYSSPDVFEVWTTGLNWNRKCLSNSFTSIPITFWRGKSDDILAPRITQLAWMVMSWGLKKILCQKTKTNTITNIFFQSSTLGQKDYESWLLMESK